MQTENAIEIAKKNDEFRRSGLGVMLTAGVNELDDILGLLQEIRLFNAFTEDNDPYGEHDFGSLAWCKERVFWKIDYYDPDYKFGRDPLDVECKRVLTVMLASEY